MWKPSAMTSPRRASSPSSASAGGQEEQPCEVKSSTTGGRVSAAAGEVTASAPSHNSAVTGAVRCNDTIPSGADDLENGKQRRIVGSHLRAAAGRRNALRFFGL